MHPQYVADYLGKIKGQINNDLLFLRQAIADVQKSVEKKDKFELEWLITAVERDAHLMKHNMYNLAKHLENLNAS